MSPRDPKTLTRLPPPERREQLELVATFSDAEAGRMERGFAPRDMDDRWFAYVEDGWLNLHRSWTGAHIFALKLEASEGGVRVVDGWASRDEQYYRSTSIASDRDFVVKLIRMLFDGSNENGRD